MFQLIKLDETIHLSADLGAKMRLFGVYAFDDAEHTYCCELAPSRFLIHVANDIDFNSDVSDDEREDLYDLINRDDTSDFYMHSDSVHWFSLYYPEMVKVANVDFDEEDSLNERIDKIREGWHTGSLMF